MVTDSAQPPSGGSLSLLPWAIDTEFQLLGTLAVKLCPACGLSDTSTTYAVFLSEDRFTNLRLITTGIHLHFSNSHDLR